MAKRSASADAREEAQGMKDGIRTSFPQAEADWIDEAVPLDELGSFLE
jgi:hypothetical protein